MRALPLPEPPRLLLSFDFDGTLHDPASFPSVDPRFFDAIRWLRDSKNAIWGINTGRSLEHLVQGFIDGRFPFLPDFAIVREREIFFPNAFGRFVSYSAWNEACDTALNRLFRKSRKGLKTIRSTITQHTGAQWIEHPGEPAGVIARTDEEMDWIISQVTTLAQPYPDLGWQRSTIYLRFGHKLYHKGSALNEVARLQRLGPANTFAIGDSHNDIDMLDHNIAHSIACPSNAVGDVLLHVNALGGYISTEPYSQGVFEALAHFFGHEG